MPDKYIDYDETQTYGHHSVEVLRTLDEKDRTYARIASRLEGATRKVGRLLEDARETRVKQQGRTASKKDVLPEAQAALSQTWFWLRAHPDVAEKHFFPNGRRDARKTSEAGVLAAVQRCARAFERYPKVPEAKARRADLERLATRLEASIRGSRAVGDELVTINPALATARDEWLETYAGAKLIVEGLLRLEGRRDYEKVLKRVFADLAVTGSAPRKGRQAVAPQATPGTP